MKLIPLPFPFCRSANRLREAEAHLPPVPSGHIMSEPGYKLRSVQVTCSRQSCHIRNPSSHYLMAWAKTGHWSHFPHSNDHLSLALAEIKEAPWHQGTLVHRATEKSDH